MTTKVSVNLRKADIKNVLLITQHDFSVKTLRRFANCFMKGMARMKTDELKCIKKEKQLRTIKTRRFGN